MSSAAKTLYTPREYLAMERAATNKHEFFQGEIVEMPGATRKHNLITLNVGSALRAELRDRPGEVYVADMRVLVQSTGLYTYPDVVVVCEEPRFEDDEFDVLLNPTLIVEVLSPSTESYDRGRKARNYRSIPSLQEYILISQEVAVLERWIRRGDDWESVECRGLDATAPLESIGCVLPLREVYAKVGIATDPPPQAGGPG